MKIKTLLITLVVSIFLLSGCPYESPVPLSSPEKSQIDARFIGKWRLPEEEKKEKGIVEILNFNDHELLILFKEENSEKIDKARAFITEVKGVSYLNYQDVDLKPEKNPWLFLKYRFSGNRLYLNTVEEDLFAHKIQSSRKLRAFFKKNQHKKDFLDMENDLTLARAD